MAGHNYSLIGVSTLLVTFVLLSSAPHFCVSCILLLNGWAPLSVGERTDLADIVAVGRALRSFKDQRTPDSNTYTAQFVFLSVPKGSRHLQQIPYDTIAMETGLTRYNVTNFGDRNACYADVTDGEEYVIFMTMFERHLSAKYDDLFGALQERTREAEEEVYEALGWKPWSDWESCSASCGGGVQRKIRYCTKQTADECEGENMETRNCNFFTCEGAKDLTELFSQPELISDIRRLRERPSAYAIDHTSRVNAPTSKIFPRGFPLVYSLMVTFRSRLDSDGYLFTISNLLGFVHLGLKTGKTLTLEFSREQDLHINVADTSLISAIFDVDVADDRWHQVALAVSEDRVDLFLDCHLSISRKITQNTNDVIRSANTVISVGKSFVESRKYPQFQGDLEQLTIVSGSTSAATQQCSTHPDATLVLVSSQSIFNDYDDYTTTTVAVKRRTETKSKATNAPPSGKGRMFWSKWSACSATCGTGLQARVNRKGITQTKPCQAKLYQCPESCKKVCRNGGSCLPDGNCRCQPGYQGRNCQTALCDPPCLNGGRCNRPGRCSCPYGYLGPDCARAFCMVECYNGGACVGLNRCTCLPGYHGNQCQTAICENGCENGGHCLSPNICSCPSGFTGKQCQTPICNPQCLNGGTCILPYLCFCPPGIYGHFCEKFICSPKCVNGGSCIGLNTCLCSNEYSGAFCQRRNCPDGCANGGTCIGRNVCLCPTGFNGTRCEHRHCREEVLHEPYEKTIPKLFKTETTFPCGTFGWKVCNRTRYEYRLVHRTVYRTIVKCT